MDWPQLNMPRILRAFLVHLYWKIIPSGIAGRIRVPPGVLRAFLRMTIRALEIREGAQNATAFRTGYLRPGQREHRSLAIW